MTIKPFFAAALLLALATSATGCAVDVDDAVFEDDDDVEGDPEEVASTSDALASDWHLKRVWLAPTSKPKAVRSTFVWGFLTDAVRSGCALEAGQNPVNGSISIRANFRWVKKTSAYLETVDITYSPYAGTVSGGIGSVVGAGGVRGPELNDVVRQYHSSQRAAARRLRVKVNKALPFEPNRPILIKKVFAPVSYGAYPQMFEYCYLDVNMQIFPK